MGEERSERARGGGKLENHGRGKQGQKFKGEDVNIKRRRRG